MLLGIPAMITSFALPAWATHATGLFSEYAPASWVVAGFMGLLLAAVSSALVSFSRGRWIRSNYDNAMLEKKSGVDPLERTFERKRIYLNEFALPSHPIVEGKTFIDCEIIGPQNVILQYGNQLAEPKEPKLDAVLMHEASQPSNGLIFRNCTFRGCSFIRVTVLVHISEYPTFRVLNWINWITPHPDGPNQLLVKVAPRAEALQLQSPPSTEQETRQ